MQLVSARASKNTELLLLAQLPAAALKAYISNPVNLAFLDSAVATPWMAAFLCSTPAHAGILARTTGVGAYLNSIRVADGLASSAALAGMATLEAVLNDTTAMNAVYASNLANGVLFGSVSYMSMLCSIPAALSVPWVLNKLLRTSGGRDALISPVSALQSSKTSVLAALSNTTYFTKVASALSQDSGAKYGGDPPVWATGTVAVAALMVNVLRAGQWSAGNGATAYWAHLHDTTSTVIGSGAGAHYLSNPAIGNTLCVGGINYTENLDAGIQIDAWKALAV